MGLEEVEKKMQIPKISIILRKLKTLKRPWKSEDLKMLKIWPSPSLHVTFCLMVVRVFWSHPFDRLVNLSKLDWLQLHKMPSGNCHPASYTIFYRTTGKKSPQVRARSVTVRIWAPFHTKLPIENLYLCHVEYVPTSSENNVMSWWPE